MSNGVVSRVVLFAGLLFAQPWLSGCGDATSHPPDGGAGSTSGGSSSTAGASTEGGSAGTSSGSSGNATGGSGVTPAGGNGGASAGSDTGGSGGTNGGADTGGNGGNAAGNDTGGNGGTNGGTDAGGNGGTAAGNDTGGSGGTAAGNNAGGNGGAAAGSNAGGSGGAAAGSDAGGNGGAAAGSNAGGETGGGGAPTAGSGGVAAGGGGQSGSAGAAGSGGTGPQPECTNGATETKSCGLNGAGTSERHCEQGHWSGFGACSDPHDCVNSTQQTKPCGLNGSGEEIRTCINGHFGAWSACSSVDVCTNGEVETAACGKNGNGTKQHTCQNGAWPAFGGCVDPDQCTNGATEHYACGLNGAGKVTRACVAGAWSDWGSCVDPDVCMNGDEQGQFCGLNQHGYQTRKCAAGQWPSWPQCNDPDECVIGASKSEACGPSNAAQRDYTCTNGKWSASVCAYPSGPCPGDLTITNQTTFDLYSRCTSVGGDLSFKPESQVQMYLTMPELQSVGGSIRLDSYYMRSVSLPVLKTLGAGIQISDSPYVFGFSAPQLGLVPGDLVIRDLSGGNGTPVIDGFGTLKKVGGNLQLFSSLNLETISFPSLEQVSGDLWLGDYATCKGNRSKNLNGFSALKSVGGSLVIAGNIWLQDISGLSNLQSVGNDLIVRYNPNVADLSAFSKLDHVPGQLMVGFLVGPTVFGFSYGTEKEITSLHGLHNIEWVGGDLTIGDVTAPDLDDLEMLTDVGGKLTLSALDGVTEVLHAPPALESLGGFALYKTPHITALDFEVSIITGDVLVDDGFDLRRVAFPTLEELSGTLRIVRMETFLDGKPPNVVSFPELARVGSIQLGTLGVLKRLAGFPKLLSVTSDLSVDWAGIEIASAEIIDFNQLTHIGGKLTLRLPAKVVGLDAFAKLADVGELSLTSTIKGSSSSSYNPTLRPSLHSFESLTHATKLTVGGFSNLEPCWAQSLALRIWPTGGAQTDFWGIPACSP